MIRGLSAYHLGQLLNFDKLENSIMAYAGDACTVSLKESGIIVPWPVICILTACHRKHIFLRSPFPHIGSIRNSLELFQRQMFWNWRFLEVELVEVPVQEQAQTTLLPCVVFIQAAAALNGCCNFCRNRCTPFTRFLSMPCCRVLDYTR